MMSHKCIYPLLCVLGLSLASYASPPDMVRKLIKTMRNEVDTQQIQWDSTASVEAYQHKELLVKNGNVYLNKDFYGNVTIHQGNLIVSDSSQVLGTIRLSGDSSTQIQPLSLSNPPTWSLLPGRDKLRHPTKFSSDFDMVYNRVQGVFLEFSFNKTKQNNLECFRPSFGLGYGFANKKIDFSVALDRKIKSFIYLGIQGFNRVSSPDYWLFSKDENTLTAFFIKEDYFTYFREGGLSVSSVVNFNGGWSSLTFNHIEYDSEKKNTDYSFFSKKKTLTENPSIQQEDLTIRSLVWALHYNKIPDFDFSLEVEKVLSSSKENLDYQIITLNHTGQINLGLWDDIIYRFKASSSDDELPWFKQMALGGFNTLRGFDFKEFTGNRLMLLNLEYKVEYFDQNQGFFNPFRIPIYFFQDFGLVWNEKNPDHVFSGWDQVTWNQINYDLGIGLGISDGIRFNIARRCDRSHDPWVFTVRINQAF